MQRIKKVLKLICRKMMYNVIEVGKESMRRKDREVTDHQEIFDILNKCSVIRLGMYTSDYPYVVPMNFGVESDGQIFTLWFHCASEGLKP